MLEHHTLLEASAVIFGGFEGWSTPDATKSLGESTITINFLNAFKKDWLDTQIQCLLFLDKIPICDHNVSLPEEDRYASRLMQQTKLDVEGHYQSGLSWRMQLHISRTITTKPAEDLLQQYSFLQKSVGIILTVQKGFFRQERVGSIFIASTYCYLCIVDNRCCVLFCTISFEFSALSYLLKFMFKFSYFALKLVGAVLQQVFPFSRHNF